MNAHGQFVTFGPDNQRIPQTAPPCWSCPKQPESVPPDKRKPLPLIADFGPWVWKLLRWFDAGRAVGFGEVSPLMREVAAVLLRDKEAGERELMRSAVVDGLRDVLKRR